MQLPILSIDTLIKCIPQRPPMVLVDGLLAYNKEYLKSSLRVLDSNIFVRNHILEEPGLIEHMAQSVALHTGYGYFLRKEIPPIGYIGSISNLQIYDLPISNETIMTEVNIIQEFAGITMVKIVSKVGDKTIAMGEMKTVKDKQG